MRTNLNVPNNNKNNINKNNNNMNVNYSRLLQSASRNKIKNQERKE
jgi:hypothetical protein